MLFVSQWYVSDSSDDSPALTANLRIWCVLFPQIKVLFDVRVTDADALLYISRSVTESWLQLKRKRNGNM